jgi:hypothetical protein
VVRELHIGTLSLLSVNIQISKRSSLDRRPRVCSKTASLLIPLCYILSSGFNRIKPPRVPSPYINQVANIDRKEEWTGSHWIGDPNLGLKQHQQVGFEQEQKWQVVADAGGVVSRLRTHWMGLDFLISTHYPMGTRWVVELPSESCHMIFLLY